MGPAAPTVRTVNKVMAKQNTLLIFLFEGFEHAFDDD